MSCTCAHSQNRLLAISHKQVEHLVQRVCIHDTGGGEWGGCAGLKGLHHPSERPTPFSQPMASCLQCSRGRGPCVCALHDIMVRQAYSTIQPLQTALLQRRAEYGAGCWTCQRHLPLWGILPFLSPLLENVASERGQPRVVRSLPSSLVCFALLRELPRLALPRDGRCIVSCRGLQKQRKERAPAGALGEGLWMNGTLQAWKWVGGGGGGLEQGLNCPLGALRHMLYGVL